MRPVRQLSALAALVAGPAAVHAYVGPGAGIAIAGGFWTLLVILLAAAVLLFLPFRMGLTWLRRRRRPASRARRVVVIGLDGLDPGLCARWMDEGRLPNLRRLAAQGTFRPLGTTLPAITPAAWSSFATGTDPSGHNIYDFITRDPRTYGPVLSSARVLPPRRSLKLGRLRLPLSRPRIRNLKGSQPFWKLLGDKGVFSSILRVPITFPPEPFGGHLLAGMCVPDLRGTQGEFTCLTETPDEGPDARGVGRWIEVSLHPGQSRRVDIPGPPAGFGANGDPPLHAAIELQRDAGAGVLRLTAGGRRLNLREGVQSPWVELTFHGAPGVRVRGICRFRLAAAEPLKLYLTAIQIDPDRPCLPLSHPASYAAWLSRRLGKYGTLGLAEDTEALDAGVIDEEAFLEQARSLHEEREKMLFHALDRTRQGLLVCVFDGPDRVQHMFYRTLDPGHPANEGRRVADFQDVLPDLYGEMDDLVGRVMDRADDGETTLLVISDHGFCPFRRGVNLNAWLRDNGYMALEDDPAGAGEAGRDWLAGVDWSRTRAFALGLAGIFLNRAGREARGVVTEAEAEDLKRELIAGLEGLADHDGQPAIRKVWDAESHFRGPYRKEAPDLLVGYNAGYRASWTGARGRVGDRVFEDNTRHWSGDHCVDPAQVPGVLFCNRPIDRQDPHLLDVPVSILRLFGVEPPAYMQGEDLFDGRPDPAP
ncbi:MAG: alkaline phosphatase family protein [Gemmatimonadaceae bacterium]|nr:alkaline phosphatase family protein [Gemmatimonadaceae bacterium]